MKKGFTLLELLVVIGILGILTGVLLGTFSGSTESARSAMCLTNMKNLASAAQAASFPPAGGSELTYENSSQGSDRASVVFYERKGWISWDSRGVYKSRPTKSMASACRTVSMYEEDDELRLYSITNGAIWKYTGGNRSVYRCPSHLRAQKKNNPNFSYVMNAAFGWCPDPSEDYEITYLIDTGHSKSERRLLFAEIPFNTEVSGVDVKVDRTGIACDAILQYQGCDESGGYNEVIGFNHKSDRLYYAHVVFQDGHVEKLAYPKAGLSRSEQQELTQWLCEASDFSFNGTRYEELKE